MKQSFILAALFAAAPCGAFAFPTPSQVLMTDGDVAPVTQTVEFDFNGDIGDIIGGLWRWNEIKEAAESVERRARALLNMARLSSGRLDHWEREAIEDLIDLVDASQDFRERVEQFRHDARSTRWEYFELRNAYFDAGYSLERAGLFGDIYREHQSLENSMRRLDRVYNDGRRPDWGGRRDRHRRRDERSRRRRDRGGWDEDRRDDRRDDRHRRPW